MSMTEHFTVIVEEGQDGYLISEVVGLPGCHSQAKTYDELLERTKEAISLYLECKTPMERYGRTTLIPNHPGEQLDRGLLIKIIKKDLQMERDEFLEFLESY